MLAAPHVIDIALSVVAIIAFGLGGIAWIVRRIDHLEDKLDNHMLQNATDHQTAAVERAEVEHRISEQLKDIHTRLHILEHFQCKAD